MWNNRSSNSIVSYLNYCKTLLSLFVEPYNKDVCIIINYTVILFLILIFLIVTHLILQLTYMSFDFVGNYNTLAFLRIYVLV